MIRIIPRIDIKGNNLVKGLNLEGLRVLGNPNDFAYKYYLDGADEIIFQDVVASLYSRENLYKVIKDAAKKIFIPITVGGGIKSLDEISKILRSGADRVSINSAAIRDREFLSAAITKYGSSTIASNIELVKSYDDNEYYAFMDNGRNNSKIKAIDWISELVRLNVGEIILTFVGTEGTGRGIDLNFLKKIEKIINCPLVVHGGIGKIKHIENILNYSSVNGLVISSMFHYYYYQEFDYSKITTGNIEFIKNKIKTKLIDEYSIKNLKDYLISKSYQIIDHEA